VLLSSQAFVDYSTSGLENPLSYLLLVLLAETATRDRPRPFRVVLLGSLLYLNRMDLALLVAPVILRVLTEVPERRRAAGALLAGAIPALLWCAAALVYYGTPFPNTAYAKLHGSVPLATRIPHGLAYLWDSLTRDPVTLLGIAVGLATLRHPGARRRSLGLGIALTLAYVVVIGGDFMSGRFLAVPLLAAMTLVATAPPLRVPRALLGIAGVLALGLCARGPNLTSGADYHRRHPPELEPPYMISDERAWYFADRRLLGQRRSGWYLQVSWPRPREVEGPPRVRVVGRVGEPGLVAGPRAHMIDRYGIVDPLLARLPVKPGSAWRPGHGEREIPAGYREAVVHGPERLEDPELRVRYARLRRITRGPLWSAARWWAILGGGPDLRSSPR